MCGIVGYIGNKEALPILLDGLKRLEYRGYDSAGICVLRGNNLNVVKKKGRIAELEKELKLNPPTGNIGLAHTRWATHGEPSERNAHPHLDCQKEIAVVHNGIIENYHALKELLIKEGHNIISDTDSEVAAHLIEKFYAGNIERAVVRALECIEGTFGLAVLHRGEEKIVIARRGSSLLVGIGNKEMFIASDAAAILSHTKKVIYLHDDEIAVIEKNGCYVKNLKGVHIDKEVHEIQWKTDEIEKGRYKHFMLKEIFEQPCALENTLRGRLKGGCVKLAVNLDVKSLHRIVITACGTSWHSALIGKYIIEKIARIPVEVDYASEFRYREPLLKEGDLVIAISQSGETADTLAALREAKKQKVKTMGIINVVGSAIAREVDFGIYLHAGPEIGVASTKAFTCQVTALVLFALFLKEQKGEELSPKILHELNNIPAKVRDVLAKAQDIKKIARKFKDSTNFLYLGRGINFPAALEGALKLKEISYIHAEGYPAAEMKHGPIALIDKNMPVVFLATKNHLCDKTLSNIQEVKARKGRIIAVVNEKDKKIEKLADYFIEIPETIPELSPIINIIPLQLLAYYIADLKGIDVDKPRNLAKSVTVE